jgi:hypothetical protein
LLHEPAELTDTTILHLPITDQSSGAFRKSVAKG